jgi:predicted enzyme related to lactoylglutathione lyase
MITNVSKVVVPVDDEQSALEFWTTMIGFTPVRDDIYADERWIEVKPPQQDVMLVLSRRRRDETWPNMPNRLSHTDLFFSCLDIEQTYAELSRRGVKFSLPPTKERSGSWALFEDNEGTQYVLSQCDAEQQRLAALTRAFR